MAKRRAPSLEEIAGEVGRLFGTTEAHARKWLQQRNTMLEALHLVRGKAADLIDELSGENRRQLKRRATAQAQRVQVPSGNPSEMMMGRKKRRMSAATRAKMRAAAKSAGRGRERTPSAARLNTKNRPYARLCLFWGLAGIRLSSAVRSGRLLPACQCFRCNWLQAHREGRG